MTRKKAITLTIVGWNILTGLYAIYYVKSTLALPNLSGGYESDWQFQLLMFCLFRFPILLIGLAVIFVVEIIAIEGKGLIGE